MPQIIYILSNPVMPGLIKIGNTGDLEKRVKDLSRHTGVPVPFEVFYACEVEDADEVEKRIHDAFDDLRINPKREFFRINPARVLSILKLVEQRDVTPGDAIVDDEDDRRALDKERGRRSSFKFSMVDIPPKSQLTFIHDPSVVATVVDDRTIDFEGEQTSLSMAARIILQRTRGITWKQVAGPQYWQFDNETLMDRRLRYELEE